MEEGLGLCPASWALLYLLHFYSHPILCPVTGRSIGPWGPPVPLGATRLQSTHLKPQAVPRSPWGNQGNLGLGIITDGREISEEQAQRIHGAAPAGEGPVASGLPRRDTDWHKMDAAAQLDLLSKLPNWSTGLLLPR